MSDIRVGLSAGTASALGLSRARMGVAPTTAYIMVGRGCSRSCAFCSQASGSTAASSRLSRITWPDYRLTDVLPGLNRSVKDGAVVRACLQVVGGHEDEGLVVLRALSAELIPVNLSLHVGMASLAGRFLDAGAARISLPLDACGDEAFARIKGGDWVSALSAVMDAARRYPGQIATHLVVGLGERQQDLLETAAGLLAAGVEVGLFAFTPLAGTAMGDADPPLPERYRQVQAVLHLLKEGHIGRGDMKFTGGGLTGIDLPPSRLRRLLADGRAFETSGCSGCNRPYYNESPRGFTYNYPRPLTRREAAEAVDMVLSGFDAGKEAAGS